MSETPGGSGLGHNAKARVTLARALAELFPGAPVDLDIQAASVDELTRALDALWPGMRDRIVDSSPAIRKHMNVFVDGQRATLVTPLPPGARVHILTAISGG